MPRSKSYTVNKATSTMRRRDQLSATRNSRIGDHKPYSYLSDDERLESWKQSLKKLGLQLRDIPADGNCLFRALADQLDGNTTRHLQYRTEVWKYMATQREDFAPFHDNTDVSFAKYLSELRKPGTFAGNDALVAFARLHRVTIVVHQLDSASFSIKGCDDPAAKELHLTYHNGEHYSSIRRIGDNSATPANIKFKSRAKSTEGADIDLISRSTKCEDRQFIAQCLQECDGEVDTTIDYINSQRLADQTDCSSCGSGSSCPYHSGSSRAGSTDTIDSGICTCDLPVSGPSTPTDQPSSPASQPWKKSTKAERKKEKKQKKAIDKHLTTDINHNRVAEPEIYEVVSQVALLSV